ncbi:MAG: co-chaperone GroES [Lentisphaeria bacterium]|nr:co-chaperone GroES [Lentisphaeria bacterium]
MAIKIQPLGDRVLVKAIEEEKEVALGGIIIPDSAKEKPQEAEVIALGTGKTDDDGKKVPFEVKVGDKVLTSKYGGTEIKLDGEEYKILNASDILAVVK